MNQSKSMFEGIGTKGREIKQARDYHVSSLEFPKQGTRKIGNKEIHF